MKILSHTASLYNQSGILQRSMIVVMEDGHLIHIGTATHQRSDLTIKANEIHPSCEDSELPAWSIKWD